MFIFLFVCVCVCGLKCNGYMRAFKNCTASIGCVLGEISPPPPRSIVCVVNLGAAVMGAVLSHASLSQGAVM